MSSPFTIFRRHQRVLMVVITGLAMISFVLLGAVQDPRELPTPLIVLFLASLVGGIAWLAGLSSGKASEWGLTGALVGAIIGVVGAFYNREASAVLLDNGNISVNEAMEIRRQRDVVNRFTQLAFQETFGIPLQLMPPQVQANYVFGFTDRADIPIQDVAITELLRREADRIGIVISDKVVDDFIKQVTSKAGLTAVFDQVRPLMSPEQQAQATQILGLIKDKKLSAKAFTNIRQALRVSETGLINAIRNELKIRQAFRLLSGNNYFPPEQFWEFYQKLNVKQSAEVASIPVKDFIDLDAKPTDAELTKLFEQYRNNFPGFTPEGRPAPGRPGFYQPRRFRIGYLEASYEDIEPLVGEVTDEEIQKRYEERYLKNVPESSLKDDLDLPFLPKLNAPGEAPTGMPEAPAAPQTESKPEGTSSSDLPAPPVKPGEDDRSMPAPPESVSKPDAPKPEATPKAEEAPKPEETKSEEPPKPEEKPKPEEPKSEETPKTEDAPKPEDAPKSDSDVSALETMLIGSRPVLFLQDEPAAEPQKPDSTPAPENKPEAKEEKPEEKPADQPEGKPAEEMKDAPKPAEESTSPAPTSSATEGDNAIPPAPSTDPPVRPSNEPPPLDDELKAQIRSEILRERTIEEISKRMEAAYQYMTDVSIDVLRQKDEKGYLTPEEATKRLELYAAQNQLNYVTTSPLSYLELRDSEEFPIGQALTLQRVSVADALEMSRPTDLYRVMQANDFTSSRSYVLWKIEDKAGYAPQTLDDDPGLRAAVTEAWNLEQARPKAKARAEALAKKIRESDQPMGTVLAEETITGTENSLFIPVRITGDFTWMQKPIVPQLSFQQQFPVRPSTIPGVENPGEEFFNEVFNNLNVGEVGVAPNNDHDTYYVVKIESRDPSTPEQLEAMRKKFLEEGTQAPGYPSMLQQMREKNFVNWLEQLLIDHEFVDMTRLSRE
jgi:hypothetical protein